MKPRTVLNPPAKYLEQLNLKQLQNTIQKPDGISAKDYYLDLQKAAKSGPMFSSETIQFIEEIPNDLSKDQMKWLANVHKKNEVSKSDLADISSILDYLNAENVDLANKTFEEIKYESDDWHSCSFGNVKAGAYKTKKIILQLKDGYSWVEVPKEDLKTEGDLMQHCVGKMRRYRSDSIMILSLRDKNNNPHVTIEFNNSGISQIQGKQDKKPIEKYHPMIRELFDYIKPEVSWITKPYLSKERVFSEIKSTNDLMRLKSSISEKEFFDTLYQVFTENDIDIIISNLYSFDDESLTEILMFLYSKFDPNLFIRDVAGSTNRDFFTTIYHDNRISKRNIIDIAVKSRIKLTENEILELIYSRDIERKISDEFLINYLVVDFDTAKRILSKKMFFEFINKTKVLSKNDWLKTIEFLLENKKYAYVSFFLRRIEASQEIVHFLDSSPIPSSFIISGISYLNSVAFSFSSRKEIVEYLISNFGVGAIKPEEKYSNNFYITMFEKKWYQGIIKNKYTPKSILSKIPASEFIKAEGSISNVNLDLFKTKEIVDYMIEKPESFEENLDFIVSKLNKKSALDFLKLLFERSSRFYMFKYIVSSNFSDDEKRYLLKNNKMHSFKDLLNESVKERLDTEYIKTLLTNYELSPPYQLNEKAFALYLEEYTKKIASLIKKYDAFGTGTNDFLIDKKEVLIMIDSYGIEKVRKILNIPSLTKSFVKSPSKYKETLTKEELEKYNTFVI